MILKWPDLPHGQGRTESALHYQIDVAATVLELLGLDVPDTWDGESFANALLDDRDEGRDYLVLSQAAWAAQRSVQAWSTKSLASWSIVRMAMAAIRFSGSAAI